MKTNNTLKHLDIGCGEQIFELKNFNLFEDFSENEIENYGIDFIAQPDKNIIGMDLSRDKIPFEKTFFDVVTCLDVLEHIPRIDLNYKTRYPFIELMNEIFRIMKPLGYLLIRTPFFDNSFFNDPTHVNPITEKLIFTYFCNKSEYFNKFPEKPWAKNYGFSGEFELLNFNKTKRINYDNEFDMIFLLQKPDLL